MAGNTTLSENYAFGGMFHLFDQHADAGRFSLRLKCLQTDIIPGCYILDLWTRIAIFDELFDQDF